MVNDEYKYYHLPESKAKLETWYAASRNEVWMVVRNGNSYTVTRRAEAVNNSSISEVGAEVVTAAFHKAIQQWINLMPEALRPAGMTAATCKCGCGQPPATKSDYATSACRVRFFRKEKRAGAQKVTPEAPAMAEPADLVIVDREWFRLTYRYKPEAKLWELRLVVDGGEKSATKEGFKALSEIVYLHADYLLQRSLEMARCALIIDYRYQDYPYLLWNITQHFALYPDPKILASSETRWHTLANLRVNKAASLMPVTMGTVDRFVALLTGKPSEETKAEAPKVTPKEKAKAADDLTKLEKAILASMLKSHEGGRRFDYKVNFCTTTKGFDWTDGFRKEWEKAFKRLQKAGKVVNNNDPTDYQHGLSDTYLASLNPPVVTPNSTDAIVADNKKRIEKIAKRILKAIAEGAANDTKSLERYCSRWGVTPSFPNDIRQAYSIVKEDGRLDKVLASLNPPKVTPDPEVDTTIADLEAIIMSVFKKYEYPIMSTFKKALKQLGFDADSKEGKSNIDAAITNLINRGLIKSDGLMYTETK